MNHEMKEHEMNMKNNVKMNMNGAWTHVVKCHEYVGGISWIGNTTDRKNDRRGGVSYWK